jgi:hypothetical protein
MSEYFGNLKNMTWSDDIFRLIYFGPTTSQVNLDWVRRHLPVSPKHSQKRRFFGAAEPKKRKGERRRRRKRRRRRREGEGKGRGGAIF